MPKQKPNPRKTKEELKDIEDAALDEGKKQTPPTKEEKLEKEVQDNIDKEGEPKVEPPKVDPPEGDEPEGDEPEKEPKKKPKQDLKKKLSASARENQKILAENRSMTKALADADDIPEPTEAELKEEYGKDEWEVMSNTEKKFAKEAVTSMRWRAAIKKAKDQSKKISKWGERVSKFINDPQTLIDNPKLEGQTNKFIKFATEDENNSVPINILVSAFLHENSSGKKKNKGGQFQRGKGGQNTKLEPKSTKISLEDARIMKANDYDEYKRQLAAGNIDLTV